MQQPPLQPSPDGTYRQPTQPLKHPPAQPPDSFSVEQTQQLAQPPLQPAGDSSAVPAPSAPQSEALLGPHWITFSQLRGHPLVDIAEGKAIGKVDDVLFDEQRRVIQAFATRGRLLHGPTFVPALKAKIGVDAVTFQPGALAGQDTSWLDNLPRASELIGLRILSDTGQFLGAVEDLRLDPSNGMLTAFELKPEQTGMSHRLGRNRRLVPAANVISYGPDTIIAAGSAIPW